MKIKNVACTQFAGIRDKNISFDDGINVVFGKNESGKSTLINLLSRTLFQNAKIDGRTDREFRETYFPGAKKGSNITGDFADGKVSFEHGGELYTLSKEWGADPRCTLATPEAVVRDQKTIDGILKNILVYNEGLYTDMLLSSQKNSARALQTLLDASQKTEAKQELADAVTMAFAESDGISIDTIEQAINKKIDEIVGKHWDTERNMPMRKSGRWSNGLGEILTAYYALEDAKNTLDEISKLEHEAEQTATEYTERDRSAQTAEEDFEKFSTYANLLAVRSERMRGIKRLEEEIASYTKILNQWPAMAEELEATQKLWEEKSNREIADKYAAAKILYNEWAELNEMIKGTPCPSPEEISGAKAAHRAMTMLENKLCGINLSAKIKMLKGSCPEIKSLRTGEIIDSDNENLILTEAVKITIPGIMEMELAPADTDTEAVAKELEKQRELYTAILKKYRADNTEELEKLAEKHREAQTKLNSISDRLNILTEDTSFEELESAANQTKDKLREKIDINRDITALCGTVSPERFIAERETLIAKNEADFGSIEGLKAKAYDITAELEKAKSAMTGTENIPGEYLTVSNPEAFLEALRAKVKTAQATREAALNASTAAASRLEAYTEALKGDPAAAAEQAEISFNEQRELLDHWLHIKEVFDRKKSELADNPMQDIADRFTHYLSLISGGIISSEFPERDRLNINIYSDNRLLDYGKLSEGTKDTVYLAFRLAALEHLFPEGGGVVVLDDPFTDMDAERAEQSCRLVKDFAKKHQVIFLTCREEYLNMLKGNIIKI